MATIVVNRYHIKQKQLQDPNYVYIGRRTGSLAQWGNKYTHLKYMSGTHLVNVATREEAVRRHREDTLSDPDLCERIRRELHGKVLVCWCKPLACHGDTLAEIADMDLTKEIGNG